MFEALLEARAEFSNDVQIRAFGWSLLLLWTLSITYMTRDFWFPSAFGLPPLSETDGIPMRTIEKERKKISGSRSELNLLTEEKRRVCESFAYSSEIKGHKRRLTDSISSHV